MNVLSIDWEAVIRIRTIPHLLKTITAKMEVNSIEEFSFQLTSI